MSCTSFGKVSHLDFASDAIRLSSTLAVCNRFVLVSALVSLYFVAVDRVCDICAADNIALHLMLLYQIIACILTT